MEKVELERKIATTNDWGLIAMLFNRLVDNFKKSISLIKDQDYGKVEELNNHSRAILTELLVQFSGDDEISLSLREVNLYINKLMTEGEIKRDPSIYESCVKIIAPLSEGFRELELKEKPKAVTGLTYGKDHLDEHILKTNRSFEG